MNKERSLEVIKVILGLVLVVCTSYGVLAGVASGLHTQFLYFTVQSNIIVLVVTILLVFTNLHKKKWFKYVSLIALVNILLTGIIFNTLLNPFWSSKWIDQGMSSFFHHLTVPIGFAILYFIADFEAPRLKNVWVALIHPAVYFLTFLFIVEPLTGFSPYPFLSATYGANSMGSVLLTCLGIIFPIILIFSVLMIILKRFANKVPIVVKKEKLV